MSRREKVQKINKKDIQYLIVRNGYYYLNIPLGRGKLFRKSLKTTDIVEAIILKRKIMASDDWNRRYAFTEMGIKITGLYTEPSEAIIMREIQSKIEKLLEENEVKLSKTTVEKAHVDEKEFKDWKTGNHQQITGATTIGKTIQQAIDDYCLDNSNDKHKDTVRRQRKWLETAGKWAGGLDEDISVLPAKAGDIFRQFKKQTYTSGTINQQVSTFVRFAKFLNDRWLTANKIPYSSVTKVQKKADEGQVVSFSPEECYKILNSKVIKNDEERAFFAVSIFTGARPVEIQNLMTKEVDLQNMRLLLPTAKSKNQAVPNEPRYIPIHKVLLPYLKAITPGKTYFFEKIRTSKSGKPRTSKELTGYKLDKILEKEKIPKTITIERQNGGKIQKIVQKRTYYSFRHSFMDSLARAGTAPDIISRMAGHKPNTTAGAHYIKDLEAYYNEKQVAINKAVFVLPHKL